MTDKPAQPYMPAGAFLASIFGASEGNVFVCALPNERGGHPERPLATRDRGSIDGFVRKWDRPGSAVYFAVGTLRKDAHPAGPGRSLRCKENVAEIVTLQSDTDLKSVGLNRDGILARLRGLYCPPSIIVWSGRGAHGYWLLNEALSADPETVARIEALNAQLADVVAGDAVQDVCRLMRLPGSHNTKDGGHLPVEIVETRFEPRYALEDLEEWLAWQSPAIARKEAPRGPRASQQALRNVFERVADEHGFKIPVDVDARLAAMSYQGAGDASIHNTQLAVTASLLTRGEAVEDVVDLVLEATKAAAGADGRNWNWSREEKSIRGMCVDWRRKHPEAVQRAKADSVKVDPQQKAQAREADRGESLSGEAETVRDGTTGAVVHHIAEERKKREKAPPKDRAKGKAAAPVVVADGVVAAIREQGGDLVLTEGETWVYEAGVWTMATAADEQWLRTLIQTGCDELGYPGDTKTANAAWKRLTEHPDLHRRKVEWDVGSIIATSNGLLDLRTREVGPYRPDAWCRAKIGQPYDAAAAAPIWLSFLDGCFRNLAEAERALVIAALQEAFGSFLATKILVREQRKALFLLGPSRTGKTQVSTVARHMIGEPIASPAIIDITGDFGMQSLHGARAWIRDDAVSEGDKIDPARFKAIVTGEGVEVNQKRKAATRFLFNIPVLLTANAMPKARDSSDAIYNRALVIEMTSVVEEDAAAEARVALGLPIDCVVADAIVEREGAGILNWALDGLDRLRARGRFDPPATMRDAVRRFRDDNNPVAAWLAVAAERDPGCRVSRNDLRCSFNGWQREEMGAEARAWGGRQFFPQVRQSAPYVNMDGEQAHDGERFVIGLRLNGTGLRYWDDHRLEPLGNGTKGYSSSESSVNRTYDGPGSPAARKTEF